MEILNDFNTSVEKALSEIDKNWKKYSGLIICGTHTPHPQDAEEQIKKIKKARENKNPFLGICFGHQLAAIEYARNVLDQTEATSEEWGADNGDFIVKRLPQLNVGIKEVFYNGEKHFESFWNNYEVDNGMLDLWKTEDNFITCQFHPEYQSSKDKPHPLLVKFIRYAKMAM